MDIYFCDLCGVRVTDADLRAGHGMRDAHDVICSACLELGHHKEWMNRRAKVAPKPAAASARPLPPRNEAGDRVATLDEDVPSSKVAPKVVVMEPTPSGAMPVLPEDHTSTAKVPTPGQPSEMPLAGAASLFSALGPMPGFDGATGGNRQSGEDEDDDLLDQADQPQVTTTPEPSASPFSDEVVESAEKAETALVSAKGGLGKAATEEADAIADEAPAKPRANGKDKDKGDRKSTSSRHSKPAPGKGKSARSSARAKAGPDVSRMILFGSLISLGVIVLIFGGIIAKKKGLFGARTAQGASGLDDKEIKDIIAKAKVSVNDALRSDELAQLESALATLNSAQDAVEKFEQTAKRNGNSDDKIDAYMESLHASDLFMQRRPVNERIMIKKSGGGH